MQLHTIKKLASKKNPKKRLGRGNGSGKGTFAGKGCKGQKSRSGAKIPASFEGGQTPILQKMPKLKGFKRTMKKIAKAINVADLNIFKDNALVNNETLLEKRFIKKKNETIKILGNGELNKKLIIQNIKVSFRAKEKIEKAGGKIEEIAKEVTKKTEENK